MIFGDTSKVIVMFRALFICAFALSTGLQNVCWVDANLNFSSVSAAKLLYGDSHGISWSDLEQPERPPPLLTHTFINVMGLDYHYRKQQMFYTGWGNIWSLQINDSKITRNPKVVVSDADGASSIAVDWENDNIYWASPGSRIVQRATLEGSERAVIVFDTGNLSLHSNLVLDPYSRFLFLATDGTHLIRTDLDGGNKRRIEMERVVVSIAVDTHRRTLYMSARQDYTPRLFACDYDGTAAREYVLTDEWWSNFVSIGVFREQLFWVHQGGPGKDTVWKATMSSNGSLSWQKEYTSRGTIIDPYTEIWCLKVFHPDIQLPSSDEEMLQDSAQIMIPTTLLSSQSARCFTSSWTLLFVVVVVSSHLRSL